MFLSFPWKAVWPSHFAVVLYNKAPNRTLQGQYESNVDSEGHRKGALHRAFRNDQDSALAAVNRLETIHPDIQGFLMFLGQDAWEPSNLPPDADIPERKVTLRKCCSG